MIYAKITRSDAEGSYTQPLAGTGSIVEGELGDAPVGTKLTIEIVEMTESEYSSLAEFDGW